MHNLTLLSIIIINRPTHASTLGFICCFDLGILSRNDERIRLSTVGIWNLSQNFNSFEYMEYNRCGVICRPTLSTENELKVIYHPLYGMHNYVLI